MKVELYTATGQISMTDKEALDFLKTADLSAPILLSKGGDKPSRVYLRPGARPSAPLPVSLLEHFPYHLTSRDKFRILHHGRTDLRYEEGNACRFSATTDIFGRAIFTIHHYNSSPAIPGYSLTSSDVETLLHSRNLDHTIILQNKVYFVSYDPELNDYVLLPTDRLYFPSKLHGVPLSFRQRHSLSQGHPVHIGNFIAQADALTASITFTPK